MDAFTLRRAAKSTFTACCTSIQWRHPLEETLRCTREPGERTWEEPEKRENQQTYSGMRRLAPTACSRKNTSATLPSKQNSRSSYLRYTNQPPRIRTQNKHSISVNR